MEGMSPDKTNDRLLKVCIPGHGGGTQRPFFGQSVDSDTKPLERPRTHDVPLPNIIREAVSFYGEDTELYVGPWTIMSVREMKQFGDKYRELGQECVQPFAFRYRGMGRVTVLSFDPEHDFCFAYEDGGANPYDREDKELWVVNVGLEERRRREVDVCFLLDSGFVKEAKEDEKVVAVAIAMCNAESQGGFSSKRADEDWLKFHEWKARGEKAFLVLDVDGIDDPNADMTFHHASKSLIAGRPTKAAPDRRERVKGTSLAHDAGGLTRFRRDDASCRLVGTIAYDRSASSLQKVVDTWNGIQGNPAKDAVDAENVALFLESVSEHKSFPFDVAVYAKEVSEELMYCFPAKIVREIVGTYYVRDSASGKDVPTKDEEDDHLFLKIGTEANKRGEKIPTLKHFGSEMDIVVPNFTTLNMRQYERTSGRELLPT